MSVRHPDHKHAHEAPTVENTMLGYVGFGPRSFPPIESGGRSLEIPLRREVRKPSRRIVQHVETHVAVFENERKTRGVLVNII